MGIYDRYFFHTGLKQLDEFQIKKGGVRKHKNAASELLRQNPGAGMGIMRRRVPKDVLSHWLVAE